MPHYAPFAAWNKNSLRFCRRFGVRVQARVPVVMLAMSMVASTCRAQWTVTILHPAGAAESRAYGVSGQQQVGWADQSASLWSGTAASWVNLPVDGSIGDLFSDALSVSGGQIVGVETICSASGHSYSCTSIPVLWNGTASSPVQLGSPGAATGVSGGQQVGYSNGHASVWSGTAASRVDLHPIGALYSFAYGVSDGQQVGYIDLYAQARASLWSGTAASWVDLHPNGASASFAFGVSDGQQAGYIDLDGQERASLWNGTAASWVDLHPAGATGSRAYGVSGGHQVGYATLGGQARASLWGGTAASRIDLHSLLPAWFQYSVARSISKDSSFIYIVGYGYNSVFGRDEALLWSQPLGACCSVASGCQDGVLPDTCVAGGGTNSGAGSTCLGDTDGDGVDEVCDECPGVDDAVFAPDCADAIPAVSSWGLVVLTLLCLTGAKVKFRRSSLTRMM